MHVLSPQSRCRFGVSRCDVTPPVGIYHRMWGAAAHERATGVHRPLTATASAFRAMEGAVVEGDEEQVFVALDHCLLWAGELQTLTAQVCQAAGLDRTRLVVTFSHTHAAGLMGLERESLPGGELIRPYLAELARRVAQIVIEARRNAAPATLSYGLGRCGLAVHRDLWDDESRQFVCGFNPAG